MDDDVVGPWPPLEDAFEPSRPPSRGRRTAAWTGPLAAAPAAARHPDPGADPDPDPRADGDADPQADAVTDAEAEADTPADGDAEADVQPGAVSPSPSLLRWLTRRRRRGGAGTPAPPLRRSCRLDRPGVELEGAAAPRGERRVEDVERAEGLHPLDEVVLAVAVESAHGEAARVA